MRYIYEGLKEQNDTKGKKSMADILALYEQHKNLVWRLALGWLKNPADAEDVCQSAFLRLLEKQSTIRAGHERAWLVTVTVNLCRDRLRENARHPTAPLDESIPALPALQRELYDAVMRLGSTEAAVVQLHYYEGFSVREIASMLYLSTTAVTSRLYRARNHLRHALEETT